MKYKLSSARKRMEYLYNRITSGIYYDSTLTPFSKKIYLSLIKFYEKSEEFEKCEVVNKIYKKRYNHKENYKIG